MTQERTELKIEEHFLILFLLFIFNQKYIDHFLSCDNYKYKR